MASSRSKSDAGAVLLQPHKVNPSPFYSHVSHSTSNSVLVTTAGQIGRRFDGSIPSDPVEQVKEAFANLSRCLEVAGARVEDVLKVLLSTAKSVCYMLTFTLAVIVDLLHRRF